MSKLPKPSDDDARRYTRLADPPHSRFVDNYFSCGPSSADSGFRDGERSTTPPELEACCRSNIVTARTRFFEEKSRSSSPATPPRRRSRSAIPWSARDDDDRHQASQPAEGGGGGSPSIPRAVRCLPTSRSTQPVPTTPVQAYQNRRGQLLPVSTAVSGSNLPVNNVSINNETDELKVLTHLQLTLVRFSPPLTAMLTCDIDTVILYVRPSVTYCIETA